MITEVGVVLHRLQTSSTATGRGPSAASGTPYTRRMNAPLPPPVGHLLQTQDGCLSRWQARDRGLTDEQVRSLLRATEWTSVHRGVLRDSTEDGVRSALRAALLTQSTCGNWPPGVALGRWTAALVHGFEGVPEQETVDVVVPRVWWPKHRPTGVRLHRCRTPVEHIQSWCGLPVTSPTWTALSLARALSRRHAVVVVDSALRAGGCTVAQLRAALPALARLRGCVQARAVVDLARPGTDSCQETRTRMALVERGLPPPDVDMRLYDDRGRLLARGELGYRNELIWIEYDGFAVHTERQAFRRDRSRQNWLVNRGWFVLRYADADLRHGETRMTADVRRARQLAPARIAALPAGLSPEADAARLALRAQP